MTTVPTCLGATAGQIAKCGLPDRTVAPDRSAAAGRSRSNGNSEPMLARHAAISAGDDHRLPRAARAD
jgi:hypothetical protein